MKSIILIFSLLLSNSIYSKTIIVTSTVDELETPSGIKISIREAIRDAATGDEIFIPNGTYSLDVALGQFIIDKDLKTEGESKEFTIIDGRNQIRLFTANRGALSIKNLTLQNGRVSALKDNFICPIDCGGAISTSRKLVVDNCLFKNNQAISGGSIYSTGNIQPVSYTHLTLPTKA